MAWLIGILCVLVVIVFWRIFLPLALVAGLIIGGLLWYDARKAENQRKEAALAAASLRLKIQNAQKNAAPDVNKWNLYYEKDPASGTPIARTAQIKSDDNLCVLSVEKRVDGTRLSGVDCGEIKIDQYQDIGVKFDFMSESQKMDINKYSNGDGVYISSNQYSYQMPYDDFIGCFRISKALALYIPAENGFWARFSLDGAAEYISLLGTSGTPEKGSFH